MYFLGRRIHLINFDLAVDFFHVVGVLPKKKNNPTKGTKQKRYHLLFLGHD